jgi:cyclic pyranopterin phosphate synthase
MSSPPTDGFHRRINYLRLSITDRCNLRCIYCMPKEGVPKLAHDDVLRYEEIIRLAGVSIAMGIRKIRITGGEPLVRRDVVHLCERIAHLPGLESLTLTTNAVLLQQCAASLYRAGVKRINISLDTLNPHKFARITRSDCFDAVWRGIETAQEVGFYPIKLNVVAMRGINDDEIEDLAALTIKRPFHVRFIEHMPVQPNQDASRERFLGASEILERLQRLGTLLEVTSHHSNGPARHYQLSGAAGKIGIISPISHHFCGTCNRLRLTADGKLRTCLFSSQETDLERPLREGASDAELAAIIRAAIQQKPARHSLDPNTVPLDPPRKCFARPMAAIGG